MECILSPLGNCVCTFAWLPAWQSTDQFSNQFMSEPIGHAGIKRLSIVCVAYCGTTVNPQPQHTVCVWPNFFPSWGPCLCLSAIPSNPTLYQVVGREGQIEGLSSVNVKVLAGFGRQSRLGGWVHPQHDFASCSSVALCISSRCKQFSTIAKRGWAQGAQSHEPQQRCCHPGACRRTVESQDACMRMHAHAHPCIWQPDFTETCASGGKLVGFHSE